VLEAADSMQALNVLDTPQHLDLMVVDVLMPEGRPHGLALARMASLRRPGLKVVYITAYYDQLPAGVVARNAPIIRKTSRIEDVVRAIEDALP
jgi:DNA-binding LytR/AlgR family response regulator